MHIYTKSIGFGDFSGSKMKEIERETKYAFTSHERRILDRDTDYCEYRKKFGERLALGLYGTVDMHEEFERDYAVPIFEGKGVTMYSDMTVEKRMDREAYIGICEDARVDISIIFYIQNAMEYLREKQNGNLRRKKISITLSGLALEGTVLLPVIKNEQKKKQQKEDFRNRMMLLSAAREGNEDAIETLTLNDMNLYHQVSQRIERKEDIFSIVDTYFMPAGVECDRYSIMGEIIAMDVDVNNVTQEEILILTLNVNEMIFDVCVPKHRVLGEPDVGRRFRTEIWLQGRINF